MAILQRVIAFWAVGALVGSAPAPAAQQPSRPPRPPAVGKRPLTTPEISEAALPATVLISGATASGGTVLGSGFIVDGTGTIVTNLHVIGRLDSIQVKLQNGDVYDRVRVKAIDEQKDLAILQVPGFNLPSIKMGDSEQVRIGDPVVLVGSPLGLGGTVSAGIVSSVRQLTGYRVLQTDAAASHGNSGGPMLDSRGQAVGVLTFGVSDGQNLNFVVPINYVRGLLSVDDNLTLRAVVEKYLAANPETTGSTSEESPSPTVTRGTSTTSSPPSASYAPLVPLGPSAPAPSHTPPSPPVTTTFGPVQAGAPGTHALVYVYRNAGFLGRVLDPPVYADDVELVRMDNKRFFSVWLSPGQHKLDAGGGSTQSCYQPVTGSFEAGMVYFLKLDLQNGCFTLNPRNPDVAQREVESLKPLNQSNVRHPAVKLQ